MPIKSFHINALRALTSHDDAVTTGARQHNLIRIQGFSITRVTVNDATINLATRKDTALLAFLADRQGRSTDRLELAELLWSNSPTAKGKHSLAQALFALKRSLGGHALELSKSSVTLLPRFISADFIEFEHELIRQNLSRAAAVFDESFFPGLDFDDAPAFNEWRDAKAARFYQQFCALLTLELRRTYEREDWVGVSSILETAANRLSNNSEIVDLHKDLVQKRPTQLASHQSADSSTRHTTAATDADPGTLPGTRGGPFLPERRQQPFVGRSVELGKLAKEWSSVVAGKGSLLMVSGHAGVGKTSLCDEFVRQVCAAGNVRVLKAQGYEAGQNIGYALLADALKNGIKEGDLARLSPALAKAVIQIMPEWEDLLGRTPTPPLAAEAAQRRLLEAVWQLVVSISKDASVLIWLDDAQWLDNATLSWMLYALRHLANHRILFLVASRYPAALNLWSQFDNTAADTCTKLQVGDLSDEDLFLLAQALRPDMSRDQMQLLKRASGGRPILALEWLKPAKVHKGSPGLHFVDETLRSASPAAQVLAELISIAGRPIDIDLLAQVVSRPPHEIVDVLADLEDLTGC